MHILLLFTVFISFASCSVFRRFLSFVSDGRFYPLGYHFPSNENIFERAGYLSSINFRRKMPNWVAECLTPESLKQARVTRKSCRFQEDKDIPAMYRSSLKHYQGNKLALSRGHLSAASHHKQSIERIILPFKSRLFISKVMRCSSLKELRRIVIACIQEGLFTDGGQPRHALIRSVKLKGLSLMKPEDVGLIDAILQSDQKYRRALSAAFDLIK